MAEASLQHEVTRLLGAAAADRSSADRLLTLLYDELRKIAQQRMHHERADHTLQATALVHEAYVRLVGNTAVRWENRAHFLAVASEAMRRILVDRARQRQRIRHGGEHQRVPLSADELAVSTADDRLVALDEALTKLASHAPAKAELIKLRHFSGMTLEEAAEALGISRATASRYWEYARVWLLREIDGLAPPAGANRTSGG